MTLYQTFVDHVRPAFERLVAEGLVGAWGLTGIGHPDMIIKLREERPPPAAVQRIANLLDSPGGLKFFNGPAKPRKVIATAHANGVGVMGIRAVQAGALTSAIDRPLPDDHPEIAGFCPSRGFSSLGRRSWNKPSNPRTPLCTDARYRHTRSRREEHARACRLRGRCRGGPVAGRTGDLDRSIGELRRAMMRDLGRPASPPVKVYRDRIRLVAQAPTDEQSTRVLPLEAVPAGARRCETDP